MSTESESPPQSASASLVSPNGSGEPEGDEVEQVQPEEKSSEDGVKVPEEFQKSANALVYEASKHELDYLRSCINERDDVLRRAEQEAQKGTEAHAPFSTEGMPSD